MKSSAAEAEIELDASGRVLRVDQAPDPAVEAAAEAEAESAERDAAASASARFFDAQAERMARAVADLKARTELRVEHCHFCGKPATMQVELFHGFYTVQACNGCVARGGLKVAGSIIGFLFAG